MADRKAISQKTRFEVFKRDSFTCQYCGRMAPEIVLNLDHIHPVSKDGDENVFNYITSCFDCNSGKSDRLLSDGSVIAKQKAQLDSLQERREQIEMMLEWREGLKSIEADTVQIVADAFDALTPGYSLSDAGRESVKKLLKKFPLTEILDAVETSKTYLRTNKKGDLSLDSVLTAFEKIGGICRMNQQPEWKKELYYVRAIVRNKCEYYFDSRTAMNLLEMAYDQGVDIQTLKEIAYESTSWTKFQNRIMKVIK
jgi:hypothetical protein